MGRKKIKKCSFDTVSKLRLKICNASGASWKPNSEFDVRCTEMHTFLKNSEN